MTFNASGCWPRRVLAPKERAVDETIAAFCGVYGVRWLENAIANVERQSTFPMRVVMAVNGGGEEVVARLVQFQEQSSHEIWIAVNERNMGPAGSYERNRDLVREAWTVPMHQDDVYLDNHLVVLRDMALSASADTLALFTAMGGISEDGNRRMAPPPIDNGHLRGKPPWIVVPEIIRRHPFPTPAMAIRSNEVVSGLAWYDSGAPDSEIFARLACKGQIIACDVVTVLYRQSEHSESNRTDWHTRSWLWAASVDRILTSSEFLDLVRGIPRESRAEFARDLLSAIPARYPSSDLFEYLTFMAAQKLCEAWDYEEGVALDFVATSLAQWGTSAAVVSLAALGAHPSPELVSRKSSRLLGAAPERTWLENRGRAAYREYGYLLPSRVERVLLSTYRAIRKGSS